MYILPVDINPRLKKMRIEYHTVIQSARKFHHRSMQICWNLFLAIQRNIDTYKLIYQSTFKNLSKMLLFSKVVKNFLVSM